MSRLEVVVPIKPLASAKSRLSPEVPDGRRQAAALAMLERVLKAVAGPVGPAHCRVVGGDDAVRRVAQEAGCGWRQEPGHDLNSSLAVAISEGFEAGASAVLFLPADLPEATPGDVERVVEASQGLSNPVGVRAQRDGGTNALLLPASLAFEPALGESSFARHAAFAEARGTTLAEADAPGLAFDVDTPADLAWAEAHVPGFAAALARWEQWLDRRNTASREKDNAQR